MASSATVQVRIDPILKTKTEKMLQEMGLTMSTAFTMMCKQILNQRRLPFDVIAPPAENIDHEAKMAAFHAFEKLEGILPSDFDCDKALEESRRERS